MKLEIGYSQHYEIRKRKVQSSCQDDFSILFLSDLHLNRFGESLVTNLLQSIQELNPSIILFGGDYVDSARGLIFFKQLLQSIAEKKNIFVIAGNHDSYFGLERIKAILPPSIVWLEKASTRILIGQTIIQIDGNIIKSNDKNDFAILVLHIPIAMNRFQEEYDLAFAGHLHGGQFVFWQSGHKLYPGRLFYKWNILERRIGRCYYLISKGLGDTLPIRFNCKKDMLFVEVISRKNKI